MSTTTKLHQLLASVTNWTDDLTYDVSDYLEANCTKQELLSLFRLTGSILFVPHDGDKEHLAEELVRRVDPAKLLAAWDLLLEERAEWHEAHQKEQQPYTPQVSDDLIGTLRRLAPIEIAALYVGHILLFRYAQERGLESPRPRDASRSIERTDLYRRRLEYGLHWLTTEEPERAEAVAEYLAGSTETVAREMGAWIVREVERKI
jgi:hypothetical protein